MFGVIFDMDGTLLDTQRICIPAWEYAGANQGIVGMGNDIVDVCGMNSIGWSNYLINKYPTLDVEKFKVEMRDYIVSNLIVKFMPGAQELLEFLKANGFKIAIASGSSLESVMHHLNEVSAIHYFDAIVGGNEVENGKPAPDIFLLAAERLELNPERCFIFEDSANGIRAGYAAKMNCIGVPDIVDFDEDTQSLMFAKINRLDEAIPIFQRLI